MWKLMAAELNCLGGDACIVLQQIHVCAGRRPVKRNVIIPFFIALQVFLAYSRLCYADAFHDVGEQNKLNSSLDRCPGPPLSDRDIEFARQVAGSNSVNKHLAEGVLACIENRKISFDIKSLMMACNKRDLTADELEMLKSQRRPHDLEAGDVLRCQKQYISRRDEEEKERIRADKFDQSLSLECHTATTELDIWNQFILEALPKAERLSKAGVEDEACALFAEMKQKAEQSRNNIIACFHSISVEANGELKTFRDQILDDARNLREEKNKIDRLSKGGGCRQF